MVGMATLDDPTPELFMVEVRVADWAKSRSWYVDVLGLRPVLEDREGRFLLLEAGAMRVALKEGPALADRGSVRLVFRVADVDEAHARLVRLGVAVAPITESDEGYREARLVDPDGTPIHLFAWVGRGVAGGTVGGVSSTP
jgi:catechol 2,3-dioxygenase-like lactoylglutathione lyase family enzyme